tara:strand:- start:5 stop:283 length:279 start_codon:yes stop_codon:yes gene_type:complete
MIKTIQELKEVNRKWFTPENKRFFNDINYKVLTGKKTKKRFFVQHTYKFSDMFGGDKKAVFIIKPITEQGQIGKDIIEFEDLNQVKQYMKGA